MPKILLVDDNEMNRDMLSRRLERKGFAVVTANDGPAGIRLAQSEKPDLVLMDMNLPEIDGWETTRRLKAAPETKAIPIIALTADATSEVKGSALAAGCDDYDSKPVELARLLGKIESLLSRVHGSVDEIIACIERLQKEAPAAMQPDLAKIASAALTLRGNIERGASGHDLRTPLNHIIGYTEMLQEDAGEALQPDLATVRSAALALVRP